MTDTLSTRDGWWKFSPYIRSREAFRTHGALRAEEGMPGYWTAGRLPADYSASLGDATYVVYSYDTPIAWWSEANGWTVPDQRYSVTTSRHQTKVRTCLDGMVSHT